MTEYRLIGPRGGYWRPEGKGYTDIVEDAGLFDEAYARTVVENTHGEHRMERVEPPEEGGRILAANLIDALSVAIGVAMDFETRMGYSNKSGYRAGLEANLAYLRKHGKLTVISS